MITKEQVKFGAIVLLVSVVDYKILNSLNTGPTISPLPFTQYPYNDNPKLKNSTLRNNGGRIIWNSSLPKR